MDGDVLTVSVSSGDASVVTAEVIEGELIELTEVGTGTSTITVTADDGNGGMVSDEFVFTVNPMALGLEEEIAISVFPNPTSDVLNIRSNQPMQVSFLDLQGMELKKDSGNSIQMNIGALSTGVYLLIIQQGDHLIKKRIIKAN